MNIKKLVAFVLVLSVFPAIAQLKVSSDHRYLQTSQGKPFFWLGDTAWELFHRLNREEAILYLNDRKAKGFTVIQAVILAELDGLNSPNPYGQKPLVDNDPDQPNEAYFKHVDYIIHKANKLGLIVALLPTWGNNWHDANAAGQTVLNPKNGRSFGEYVGKRYKDADIVWVLGGDRDVETPLQYETIRAMAAGLKKGDGGKHLMTFHPKGERTSSEYFKDDAWMDFNMSQTGHYKETKTYSYNQQNLALSPIKPHVDGEPRYEDHPNQFSPLKSGWMDDFDARQTAYWSMLSGAFGHTYGNHNIWQFYTEQRKAISWARTHWKTALSQPGAIQIGIMRALFEKRNWQRLRPDQSIVAQDNPENVEHIVAASSLDGDFLMAYLPYGQSTKINTQQIKGTKLNGWLFNPRDGRTVSLGTFDNTGIKQINPHAIGRGSDWVVIIDDAARDYGNPRVVE